MTDPTTTAIPADVDRFDGLLRDHVQGLFGGHVGGSLSMLGIATEELGKLLPPLPTRAASIAFLALMPSVAFRFRAVQVYRAHCRELLARAQRLVATRGAERASLLGLHAATSSEMLCAVSDASQRAPFNAEGLALYERLFEDVFGADAVLVVPGYPAREPWRNQATDAREELRRKMGPQREPKLVDIKFCAPDDGGR